MLKIFLTNLGKYNEGYLIGEWVTLPITDNRLEEVKKRIGINKRYEEWLITDYESDVDGVEVNEYASIQTLNELAEALEELDEYELEIVGALLSEGYSIGEALEKKDDCFIYFDCNNMEDVAITACEHNGILEVMPEELRCYFDFAAYGRDMFYSSHFVFTDNGNCIEIL